MGSLQWLLWLWLWHSGTDYPKVSADKNDIPIDCSSLCSAQGMCFWKPKPSRFPSHLSTWCSLVFSKNTWIPGCASWWKCMIPGVITLSFWRSLGFPGAVGSRWWDRGTLSASWVSRSHHLQPDKDNKKSLCVGPFNWMSPTKMRDLTQKSRGKSLVISPPTRTSVWSLSLEWVVWGSTCPAIDTGTRGIQPIRDWCNHHSTRGALNGAVIQATQGRQRSSQDFQSTSCEVCHGKSWQTHTKITQTLWATMSQRLCHCQPTWRSTQWAHVFLTLKEHRLILHAIWRFNLLRLSGFIVQECRSKSPRWRAGRMGVQNMTNINQRNADATCCLLLATRHRSVQPPPVRWCTLILGAADNPRECGFIIISSIEMAIYHINAGYIYIIYCFQTKPKIKFYPISQYPMMFPLYPHVFPIKMLGFIPGRVCSTHNPCKQPHSISSMQSLITSDPRCLSGQKVDAQERTKKKKQNMVKLGDPLF